MHSSRPHAESAFAIGACGVLASAAGLLMWEVARQPPAVGKGDMGAVWMWFGGALLVLFGAVFLLVGLVTLKRRHGPGWAFVVPLVAFPLAAVAAFRLGGLRNPENAAGAALLAVAACLALLATAVALFRIRAPPPEGNAASLAPRP